MTSPISKTSDDLQKREKKVQNRQPIDLTQFVESAKTLKRKEMYEKHPREMARYKSAYLDIKACFQEKRSWKTEVICVIGDHGSGKKHWCKTNSIDAYCVTKARGGWWNEYDGHETVIIEDFAGWIKIGELLQLTDRYDLMLNIRGGQEVNFVAKKLFITSVCDPTGWWQNTRNKPVKWLMAKLIGRIDRVIKVENTEAKECNVEEWKCAINDKLNRTE